MKKHLFIFLLSLFYMLHAPCSLHAQVPSYVPTSGLVGWWPFNGNANDESGNGNNGTVNGATLTTDRFGVANRAIYNNSNPQYLSFPNGASTVLNLTNDFSFGYWVKTSVINTNNGFLSFGDNVANAPLAAGIVSGLMNAGKLGVGIRGTWYQSNAYVNNNVWRFVFVTYESGTLKFFIDGILDSQFTGIPNPLSWNGNRTFGCRSDLFMNSNTNYIGYVDDIAIYNRALSEQEITNLYTSSAPPTITTSASPSIINCGESATLTASSTSATQPCVKADLPTSLQTGLVGYWPFCGNANDASGNNNNGTVNGATLTTDRFGNANSAYSFDGVSNYIQCLSPLTNHSTATISGWAYLNSNDGNGYVQIGIDGTTGGCNGYAIGNGGATFTSSGTNLISLLSCVGWNNTNSVLPIQSWFQFTLVKSASNFLHYINGILVNTSTISNLITPANSIFFGASAPQALNYHNGKLDDIAIYNRALSASEIQQLYNLGNVNYTWSTGATTPSITVSPAQTTSYSCTATNSAGSTTNSVTVTVADSLSWTGLFDTDWHKPCNWSPQFVPKCCNNVLIPVTSNQPIVSGVAAAEDLTIYTTNGAQVTVNNGANLQIADCPTTITTTACPSLAVITTTAVSSVTLSAAISGGTITYQGESAITARGICWSTSQNPTIANSFTTNGTGVGTFTSNLTGLTAGTTYYVRAYATNASGTSYGNEVSFVSQSLQIGNLYEGGVISFIDNSGQHGFIVSQGDAGYGLWGLEGPYGAMSLYDGLANTNWMVSQFNGSNLAGTICNNLVLNGYSDWYLPSQNQMSLIYQNIFSTGLSAMSGSYWTSTGYSSNWAMRMTTSGSFDPIAKQGSSQYIRAIRNF